MKIHQDYPDMGSRRMNDGIKKYSESHRMVSDSLVRRVRRIPVSYTHLALMFFAIGMELTGTTLLKYSQGFTKLLPTIGCLVSYFICFLSLIHI